MSAINECSFLDFYIAPLHETYSHVYRDRACPLNGTDIPLGLPITGLYLS